MQELTVKLDFSSISSLFAKAEISISVGKRLYENEKTLLSTIYSQLPNTYKAVVVQNYPYTLDVLGIVKMMKH